MVKKKKIVAKKEEDHTISMIILGVVAVISIVGLVLLFSAAQSSGLGIYGGAIKGLGSFTHQEVRGVPATICPEGTSECHTVYQNTALRRGIQDVDYNHLPSWQAYRYDTEVGWNSGYLRKCGDDAIKVTYPMAGYYQNSRPNLNCEGEIRKDKSGLCCFMTEGTLDSEA
ncbi:hypothetical protein DRJ25_02405 [Candidatus Woesearchaeota archaeon]|nr:MAG: hypothetical protein DRJ25_02405 [Candidatus Woesearchaeota archaeon]